MVALLLIYEIVNLQILTLLFETLTKSRISSWLGYDEMCSQKEL